MTSCAGLCRFQPQNGSCNIRLSEPLLKLRPRRDLVETVIILGKNKRVIVEINFFIYRTLLCLTFSKH